MAYFPDMVNLLLLGDWMAVPKPHGPEVHGEDQFERAFLDAVPHRRDKVVFIEDWCSYHERLGEVHCGTNAEREPFRRKWWEYKPPAGFDL